MKFPNHILLDIATPSITNSNEYWIFKYLNAFRKNIIFLDNLSLQRKFYFCKENLLLNKLLQNQKQYTIRYNYSNSALFLNDAQKEFYKNVFQPRIKVKHRVLESNHYSKEIYTFLNNIEIVYDEKLFKRLIKNFTLKQTSPLLKSNILWSLFNINFLKKERIYTKLKYSRVPQYDIVSGGSALIFGGFLGFLICEKFGFELIDSGDFYFLFMYVVLLCFALRLFLRIMDGENLSWNIFSFKWLIYFYLILINFFKNYFKKLL